MYMYVYRVCQLDMLHFEVLDDQLKVDLQVLKKVAAHSGGLDIWVLSIKIQKSNIGEPRQPLTERLSNISKILDF